MGRFKTMLIGEVAETFQVTPKTIRLWVKQGTFPKPTKVTSGSKLVWRESVIEALLEESSAS